MKTQITLPSGKVLRLREAPKGRTLRDAAKVCGPDTDSIGFIYALAARMFEVDGQPFVMEDIDDMPIADAGAIMAAVQAAQSGELIVPPVPPLATGGPEPALDITAPAEPTETPAARPGRTRPSSSTSSAPASTTTL